MMWPDRASHYRHRTFVTFASWSDAVAEFDLNSKVPVALANRWTRVQNVYLSAWLEPDLLVVGDLVAFTALEYAMMDRYGALALPRPKYNPKHPNTLMRVSFAQALDYIVTGDGLTDEQLPFVQKYGGSVVRRLKRRDSISPTLPEMRNRLAHGDPIEAGPGCGLPELIRDLIDYAYRNQGSGLEAADPDAAQPEPSRPREAGESERRPRVKLRRGPLRRSQPQG